MRSASEVAAEPFSETNDFQGYPKFNQLTPPAESFGTTMVAGPDGRVPVIVPSMLSIDANAAESSSDFAAGPLEPAGLVKTPLLTISWQFCAWACDTPGATANGAVVAIAQSQRIGRDGRRPF
jgi:hypothetical protein